MDQVALVNAGELVTCSGPRDQGEASLGIIEDGAMLIRGGRVAWVGTTKEFRRKTVGRSRPIDAGGGVVTPGFIDPHTHLVFAGGREDELERKALGESYVKILESGGGITRTISETRKASTSRILGESADRLRQLADNGVTTAEVKTGYGGDLRSELKLLTVIESLRSISKVELVATFLGLHSKPPEFRTNSEYVGYAVREMLPAVAELKFRPVFSDCFCESGVFTRSECRRYLQASKDLGFLTKLHADEFSDTGGAALAADLKCVSADHLGHSSSEGMRRMKSKKVTAVLLPLTSLYSGIPFADARAIKEAGCDIALGTDLSPNSWVESPQLVMGVACCGMRMTPGEALLGFTSSAAKAIGRKDVGRLAVGCYADFIIHAIRNHRFLPYRIGGRYVSGVYKRGVEATGSRRSART